MGCCAQRLRPAADVCVIRAVARSPEGLLTEQASWVQRMQKALVQMNIQLTEVISDVMGQAIIGDIVSGQRDVLARHRQPAHPGQRARHRASADGQLARGAPVRAQAGAGDV
jgi:hypothetical protein